ncbi:MAG: alcohol dehydrogenase catalytic domain-containing protein, partial [Burkholderiales bacterium]
RQQHVANRRTPQCDGRGRCHYCVSGLENLCDNARFTGYHRYGGYSEYVVANHR